MEIRKVKLIAVDLDGTLLNSQGRLPDENRAAIQKAIEEGIFIVIASGRPFASLPDEVLDIVGIEYAITSNGAAVYHIPTRKRLKGYHMTSDSVEQILELGKKQELILEAFVDGVAYADKKYVENPVEYGASERAVPYIQRTRNKIEDMEKFIRAHIRVMDSIDIVVRDSVIKEQVESLLESVDDIYVTSSVKQLVEISHKDAGKHTGMMLLGDMLGVARDEMIAIGNDNNDIEMLSFVDCGIAVANASEKCLAAAKMVVSSHDENGVKEAIYKFL